VPVLPVGVVGARQIPEALAHLRRAPVTVRFGPPFRLRDPGVGFGQRRRRRHTDEIMFRIASLLPANERGYYQSASPGEADA